MLTFFGYQLELYEIEVLSEGEGVTIRSGTDLSGQPWLIVGLENEATSSVWVCAPLSSRMLEEVAAGRAAAWDAVRHSVTGTVEVIRIDRGRAVPDRCVRTSDLPPERPGSLCDLGSMAA